MDFAMDRAFLPNVSYAIVTGAALLLCQQALGQPYYQRPLFTPAPSHPHVLEADAQDTGSYSHDGYFLRVAAGAAYLRVQDHGSYTGTGSTYTAAVGHVIDENLVLFGELLDTAVIHSSGAGLNLFGFGPGLAYYFEPINAHLSGGIAFSTVRISPGPLGGAAYSTKVGMGLNLSLGKEWWLAREWGIGLAGQGHLAAIQDGNDRASGASYGVLVSATYN
jgi:hypothetical protein